MFEDKTEQEQGNEGKNGQTFSHCVYIRVAKESEFPVMGYTNYKKITGTTRRRRNVRKQRKTEAYGTSLGRPLESRCKTQPIGRALDRRS